MKMKTIHIILIVAAVCTLLSVYLASSHVETQGPEEVDMAAVIKGLSANASFEYSFISAEQLKQVTAVWQQAVPSRVRDMWGLGPDNLLVVCEKDLSSPSPYVKPTEETISIFDPTGNIIAQNFLGEYKVRNVYQSHTGSLVNIETENDHNALNIVTDHNGSSFLQIEYRFALLPSWDGEYLIKTSPLGRGLKSVATIDAGGREREVAATRFMNKDGSSKTTNIAEDFHEEKKGVLWVFDNNDLLFVGRDSSETTSKLTLYDILEGRKVWELQVPPLTSVDAVCSEKDGQSMYLLLSPSSNERGVHNFVISRGNAELVSESFGNGAAYSIGSDDGYFYSVFSGESPPGQTTNSLFVLKHTPKLEIERYGVLCQSHSLHSMKLCGEYLYGFFENFPLSGKTIRYATAIYNMGGNLPGNNDDDLLNKKVEPVILEGNWYIRNISRNDVELVGQLDPVDGCLTKVMIDRSWLR
jgi:hypothetical protein